jgi:glycosyltransferase involved in cell wall biosynthesis
MFSVNSGRILRVKISAVIIAFNEEVNIADAIKSVSWADEILVIDSGSTDRTREIAEEMGAAVSVNPWTGFSDQKQFGAISASNDWILSLDADERVTGELKTQILALANGSSSPQADGFTVRRLAYYMGRPIRHGGWYPDAQLRLFDRRKGHWNDALVHESVKMDPGSKISDLSGEILHFSVENALHHHQMIGERYSPLAAAQMFASGRRTTRLRTAFAGPAAFVRSYILKLGFLDGFAGYSIASFAAHHAFLKHLILWETQRDAEDK